MRHKFTFPSFLRSRFSGRTRRTTDSFGRPKQEHFDRTGRKIGESRSNTDWLGRQRQDHFDATGHKFAETRPGCDWIGRDNTEHFDARGYRIGHSHEGKDWLGRPTETHFNRYGTKIGTSSRQFEWLGRGIEKHYGEYFKGRARSADEQGGEPTLGQEGLGQEGYQADESRSGSGASHRTRRPVFARLVQVGGVVLLAIGVYYAWSAWYWTPERRCVAVVDRLFSALHSDNARRMDADSDAALGDGKTISDEWFQAMMSHATEARDLSRAQSVAVSNCHLLAAR